MKKFHTIIFLIGLTLFVQSCAIMYAPNMQNVPLFQEKNETKATVSVQNYQVAYSVSDHFGIMINGQYRGQELLNFDKSSTSWGNGITSDYNYDNSKGLLEAGAGYFSPLGKSFVAEIYGGGGIGFANFNQSVSTNGGAFIQTGKYSAATSRLFIQSNIGLTLNQADIAFSSRFTGLRFSNIHTSGYSQEQLDKKKLNRLDKPYFVFWEPALIVRAGYKYIKFHVQVMLCAKLNSAYLAYNPLSCNVGAHINLAPRFKK